MSDTDQTKHRMQRMRRRLLDAFEPTLLELVDEGHLHVGHAGAQDGRGHFRLTIESEQFVDLRPIARHRMIYAVLKDLMTTDIHALAINAHAPGEAQP